MSCKGLTGKALANCQKKRVSMVGENVSRVRTKKNGTPYSLILDDTQAGTNRGDTVVLPRNYPRGKGSRKNSSYLSGGDYTMQKIGKKKYGNVRLSEPLAKSPLPKSKR